MFGYVESKSILKMGILTYYSENASAGLRLDFMVYEFHF